MATDRFRRHHSTRRGMGACLPWCGYVRARKDGRRVWYELADNRLMQPMELAVELATPNAKHLATCTRIGPEWVRCPWKGLAGYYDVVVDGRTNRDGACYDPTPSPAAAEIKDHGAFRHGVKVTP